MEETKCMLKMSRDATDCDQDIKDVTVCRKCGWWKDEYDRRWSLYKTNGLTVLESGRRALVEKKEKKRGKR